MDHARIECSCGILIAQCRCLEPHPQEVVIREQGCVVCLFASLTAIRKAPEIAPVMSPHQPGHECAECHKLDEPLDNGFTLRDLIFQAIYAELSGGSILHYLIARQPQQGLKDGLGKAITSQLEG